MNIKEKYDKNLSKKNKGLNPLVGSTIIYHGGFQTQTNGYAMFSNLLDVCLKKASLLESLYDYIFSQDELREQFLSYNILHSST